MKDTYSTPSLRLMSVHLHNLFIWTLFEDPFTPPFLENIYALNALIC